MQALYIKKSSNKNVTAVTPINQPPKLGGDDSLVVIDFHAPVSEKKRSPIKHAASVGDHPQHHSNISPALLSQSSHHTTDSSSSTVSSSRKQRHAVIHKQHTTGDIPDHSPSRHHRAVVSKQHSLEDNHHSPLHHDSKHSTKSTKSGSTKGGGDEWVSASRKGLLY